MKIAFDVNLLALQMSNTQMVHQVAGWGYKCILGSPAPHALILLQVPKGQPRNVGRIQQNRKPPEIIEKELLGK
jgi:hypothetical protein